MVEPMLNILSMNSDIVMDRLWLCWGHLDDWMNLEIVERCRQWLKDINLVFTPSTFIAYLDRRPVGMIEFVPQRLLKQVRLCPCRVDPDNNEIEDRYILGREFCDYLFITCILVNKEHQGEGIGKALLRHFLNSDVFKNSEGAVVYVTEKDESWSKHIHWPAGPREFYLKEGFSILKTVEDPKGYFLSYTTK